MYKPIVSLLICCSLFACSNKKKEPVKEETTENNYLMLRSDTVNVVKTTDTLLVSESTCRGCAYETSTEFGVTDSMDIVKIEHVYTADNSPADMNGGSISKDIILTIAKPGLTKIRLYKFWKHPETAADSTLFTIYTIDARN